MDLTVTKTIFAPRLLGSCSNIDTERLPPEYIDPARDSWSGSRVAARWRHRGPSPFRGLLSRAAFSYKPRGLRSEAQGVLEPTTCKSSPTSLPAFPDVWRRLREPSSAGPCSSLFPSRRNTALERFGQRCYLGGSFRTPGRRGSGRRADRAAVLGCARIPHRGNFFSCVALQPNTLREAGRITGCPEAYNASLDLWARSTGVAREQQPPTKKGVRSNWVFKRQARDRE